LDSPCIEILELSNNEKALLFRVIIQLPVSSVPSSEIATLFYYAAVSEDRFWLRKGDISFNFVDSRSGIPLDISKPGFFSEQEDFIFRIDTSDTENIAKELRRMSAFRLKQNNLPVTDRELLGSSIAQEERYSYLINHFSNINKDYKNSAFNLNFLFLLLLDKLITFSIDDAKASKNTRKLLDILSKPALGKVLIYRMIFFKYTEMFYRNYIRVWEKSVFVKSALHEYYKMLLNEELEKCYEPDYIAFDFTHWFDQPENDLKYFIQFVDDSGFSFNE
jgi:hypothetical protein